MPNTEQRDITIDRSGTIFLFTPRTERAEQWMRDNLADHAQFIGPSLAVDHRYAEPLTEGMLEDGLTIE